MIDTLHPIGLDELVRRASLLTRFDRKYLLPTADLPLVFAGLAGDDVRALEIDGRRDFAYQTIYFDTPGLDCYLATARRRRRRVKLRIRSYLDSDRHFFEVKTRDRRGATVKHRIPYTGDHRQLSFEALEYARTVLAETGPAGAAGIAQLSPGTLRLVPVLTARFRRTTLFVSSAASRVTFDTALTWALTSGAVVQAPDRAIVETKSGRITSDVDRLLWSLRHRPFPMSKYGTGLAALRPDLPANRWHSVLRRHFLQTGDEQ